MSGPAATALAVLIATAPAQVPDAPPRGGRGARSGDTGTGVSPHVSAADLEAVPAPLLDAFEPAARERLEHARAVTARLVAESRPEAAEAFGALCLLYLRHELLDSAAPCLERARRLHPDDFRWPYYEAFLHSRNADFEQAIEAIDGSLALAPRDPPALVRKGDLHLRTGNAAAAERAFHAALEVDPGSAAARYGLGRVAAGRGEHAAAARHFEAALAGQPEGSVLHHHLGMAYRGMGDLERAREELARSRGVELAGADPLIDGLFALDTGREAAFTRGVESLERGDARAASEAFRRVIELDPSDARAHYNLARAQVELGALAEAESHLRRALELLPEFFDAHVNLAILYGRTGRGAEAAAHLARAVAIDPGHLPTRVLYARVLAGSGAPERAIAELEAVLRYDPSTPEARLTLGALRAESGDLAGARRELTAVLDSGAAAAGERTQAHLRLARLPGTAIDDAESHLRAAVKLEPSSTEARGSLAQLLARRGELSAAAAELERLVEIVPDDARARLRLATTSILAGRHAEARAALEAGVERLPESLALRQLLARFLATCPEVALRDGERAVALAEEIMEREPSPDHRETLAMALAEAGRFADAVQAQERALSERAAAGQPTVAAERWLAAYRRGQPVREPWRQSAATAARGTARPPG